MKDGTTHAHAYTMVRHSMFTRFGRSVRLDRGGAGEVRAECAAPAGGRPAAAPWRLGREAGAARRDVTSDVLTTAETGRGDADTRRGRDREPVLTAVWAAVA